LNALASRIASNSSVRAFLVVLPALACFCFDLFNRQADISAQVGLHLAGGQLVQEKLLPYVDFWDWSQPVVYWLFSGPFFVNQLVEKIPYYFAPQMTFKAAIFLLTLFSLCLSLYILFLAARWADDNQSSQSIKDELQSLFVPLSTAYVLALFCTRFEFGDLQELFMLTFLPWLIVRWLKHHIGVNFNNWLLFAIGTFMGFGAILDLPHLPIVVALEFFFILAYGRWRPDFSILALSLFSIIDLTYLFFLPQSLSRVFWHWTMPIRARQFMRFDSTIGAYTGSPDRRDALYLLVGAVFLGLLLQVKQDFLRPLVVLGLIGFALYVGEGDGFSSGLIITIWSSCFIFAVSLPQILQLKKVQSFSKYGALVAAVMLLVFSTAFQFVLGKDQETVRVSALRLKEAGGRDIFDVVNQFSQVGEKVMVLADYPAPIYPLLFYLDRRQGSYMLWSRPLRIFTALNHLNCMTDDMRSFQSFVYDGLAKQIKSRVSPLILVSRNETSEMIARSVLMPIIESGYKFSGQCVYCSDPNKEPVEHCGYDQRFDIYIRRSP